MFEKILYPTDFSTMAKKTFDYIEKLKDAGAKEVVVLNVLDIRDIDILGTSYSGHDFLPIHQALEDKAKEEISYIGNELRQFGFRVKTRVVKGIPFSEILRIAEEEDVSLIVIASHGKSNIAEMFLGSVSEKVIRKSKRPVLVIKR